MGPLNWFNPANACNNQGHWAVMYLCVRRFNFFLRFCYRILELFRQWLFLHLILSFKLFSYFFALFLIFLDIDACAFKSFGFYVSHFIHASCLFTSIYNVLLNYASATAVF